MSTNTNAAVQIAQEEREAAELEGFYEASEDMLELIARRKQLDIEVKERKAEMETIDDLIREDMLAHNKKHLTKNGVKLTTLFRGSRSTLLVDEVCRLLGTTPDEFKSKFYNKTKNKHTVKFL